MACFVQRVGQSLVRGHRLAQVLWKRCCSSDALMEVDTKPGEVGMVSGVPEQHLKRRVIIYSPARTATQQGSGKVGKWKINFLSTHKWENPLMGWTSTGDPYANVGEAGLEFDSEEAAKAFADKYGWEYQVKKRHTPLLKDSASASFSTSSGFFGACILFDAPNTDNGAHWSKSNWLRCYNVVGGVGRLWSCFNRSFSSGILVTVFKSINFSPPQGSVQFSAGTAALLATSGTEEGHGRRGSVTKLAASRKTVGSD
ncbi:hypothetical protein V6N12_070780 [Hibiscus sabdariffa]|uniref:NADH dehydrogenase [ubiquinone] iron-sulfur protein 4, mitochondrial n=2 Tax=Hibiscus sabdariffa TaxID=183260 RepID=A0ABR2FHU2_9ROSI